MKALIAAFDLLTPFSWPNSSDITPDQYARSFSFFPLVGICLGLILAVSNRLLEAYLASEILSVILVMGLILITGAVHLAGLREIFDELRPRKLQAKNFLTIRESKIEILGLIAVLIIIVLKVRSVEVMGEARSQGLLLAPVLARWAMVILAHGSLSAREGVSRFKVEHIRGRDLWLASAFALISVFVIAGTTGLWIALWISLFALLSRIYLHRRMGGITQDSLGAVAELSETLALLLFSSL